MKKPLFTTESLSSKIGLDESDLIKLLKEKGIEVKAGQELTLDQVKLLKDGIKGRQKMSISGKATSDKKTITSGKTQTIKISRLNKTQKSTTKLTLSKVAKPIKTIKKVELEVKPTVSTRKVKAETAEAADKVAPQQPSQQTETESPPEPVAKHVPKKQTITSDVKAIEIGTNTTLQELSQKTLLSETDLAQAFFNNGYMIKKNDPIDFDTAALLLDTLNIAVSEKQSSSKKTRKKTIIGEATHKAPVVTIMGHVDHGKTSLLDYIRSTKVAAKESGGITQHIGAYQVNTKKGLITFLDTPGHEAFSAMRGRGANLTDIIVLIVAANDGVKPQTIESIQHAKSTNTPIIVAITKIDTAEAGRVDSLLSELSNHDVVAESWGGGVAVVNVSSKTGEGIDDLLEAISLQAEIMELAAHESGPSQSVVIESKIDRGRGAVITLIVESGTLSVGDILTAGPGFGKVRTMIDSSGKKVKLAKPAMPVEITGISPLPSAGDAANSQTDEKAARQAANEFQHNQNSGKKSHALTLDDLFNQQSSKLRLQIILKADTHGSLEAISTILNDLEIEETELDIIDQQVGSINPSDVTLAASTDAQIIAFHVNTESSAKKLIEQHAVQTHQFKVLYPLIDHVKEHLVKLKGPTYTEHKIGMADVKAVFRSSKFGQIAGCLVSDGIIKRGEMVRVLRKGETVFEGELASLKREKETLTEARKNTECGLGIKGFAETKVGDQIECYSLKENV